MNITEATQHYLSYVEHTRNLSKHTIKAYQQDINQLIAIVGQNNDLTSVSRTEIRAVINSLFSKGQAKSTVKRRIACYKSMFSWFENEEMIEQTPFHKLDIKIKLPLRLPRNIGDDELRKLRNASLTNLASENFCLNSLTNTSKQTLNHLTTFLGIELLLTTGLRISELTAIQLHDIHLSEKYIHIQGKGQRERRVFVTSKNIEALIQQYIRIRVRHASDHTTFLINRQGRATTAQTFRLWLKSLSKQAQLSRHVTPHMYRHSAATKLLEAGVDTRYVQRLLGHQSITTTQIYTHVNNASLYDAIVGANIQEDFYR